MTVHQPSRDHYDVVVIGAGAGGLTSAALLAQHGRRVLVIDPEMAPGGNLAMFNRGPYRFDVGVHYVGDCGPDGVIPGILRGLGQAVEFTELDPNGFDTFLLPDFTFRCPSRIDRYRERLVDLFPESRRGIDHYIRFLTQTGKALPLVFQAESALLPAPPHRRRIRPGLAYLIRLLQTCPSFLWNLRRTLGRFLDDVTHNPALRALLGANHATYGVGPGEVAAALHTAVTAHYFQGAWYPKGGGQALADALTRAVESQGGEVLLRTRVERILIENGRARGVVAFHATHGTLQVGAETVISNADYRQTQEKLIGPEHLGARTRRFISASRMAYPLFVLYLGVAATPAHERLGNTNFHILPDYDVDGFYRGLARGALPERPHTFLSIATLKDPDNPDLAPRGIINMEIMCPAPPEPEVWGVTPAQVQDHTYREVPAYLERKKVMADRLLASAERVIPGLRDLIRYQTEATPLTSVRHIRATAGSSYGLAGTPEQFGLHRPGCRCDIPNVFLAGASLRTCHGIDAAVKSGVVAADAVLGRRLVERIWNPDLT